MGYQSAPYSPKAGVPQGSSLSPILFNIFVNDIPAPTDPIKISQFADDIAIWGPVFKPTQKTYPVQNFLDQIVNWSLKWRIKINSSKTVSLPIFNRKISNLNRYPKVTILDNPVPHSSSAKFLGATYTNNFRKNPWLNHFRQINTKFRARLAQLAKISKSSIATQRSMLTLFKLYARPIIEHGLPATFNIPKSQLKALQITQNKCLRLALKAPRRTHITELHQMANVQPIEARFRTRLDNYFHGDNSIHRPDIIQLLNDHTSKHCFPSPLNTYLFPAPPQDIPTNNDPPD